MSQMFYFMILSMMLFSILYLVFFVLSKKKNYMVEKMSPFECGFDLIFEFRIPFSINFFLITIIFLIFDVEIIFFLPLLINIYFVSVNSWLMSILGFIFILLIGLFHEWFLGSLNWKI